MEKDPERAWPDLSELQAPETAQMVMSETEVHRAIDAHEPPLPEPGLFGFYDRLREKVLHAVEAKAGRFSEAAVEALLLVPDVFILLVRLALDPEVPKQARALIAGALAYFVLPVDLLPEALLGAGGFLEDLVLASSVLSHAFGGELEPYAKKHWSGSHELQHVLQRVTAGAHRFLETKVLDRLGNLMHRRGVKPPAS
jgi:uncharacterized membrane protein YkvA (DUF1232 family)